MTSTRPLANVRVLEVATHVFVPMAGSVLTEWGADVIKIEHPETGDPYRSLVTAGLHNVYRGVDPFFQSANRGKRSVGLDLKHPDGRALLGRLLQRTDVFMTSLRADARRRLHLDVDAIRADNPSCVYVRGTAFGVRGPDAGRGGYDTGSYWARSGMQHLFTSPDAAWPPERGPRSVTSSAGSRSRARSVPRSTNGRRPASHRSSMRRSSRPACGRSNPTSSTRSSATRTRIRARRTGTKRGTR